MVVLGGAGGDDDQGVTPSRPLLVVVEEVVVVVASLVRLYGEDVITPTENNLSLCRSRSLPGCRSVCLPACTAPSPVNSLPDLMLPAPRPLTISSA